MIKYKIRAKLLRAIAACTWSDAFTNSRISGVLFRDDEIIATNGHALLRVPAKHGLSLMMPTALAVAACEASLAGSDGQVDGEGYPVDDYSEVVVSLDGDDVVVDIGGVSLRAASMDASTYPDIAKCTTESTPDGNPMRVLFDPHKLALVGDVIAARGYRETGIEIVACGRAADALVFRHEVTGITLTLMPMLRRDK